ncbi:MAG: hypothetical protein Q8N18_21450 [Opitutaceae bacterium]|nr:hypothetical protein [Opitutaceae bacterium]
MHSSSSASRAVSTLGLALTLLLSAVLPVSTCAAAPVAESIFDGKTLAGWDGKPEWWRVEDGAITGEIAAGQRLLKNTFIFRQGGEVADFALCIALLLSVSGRAGERLLFDGEVTLTAKETAFPSLFSDLTAPDDFRADEFRLTILETKDIGKVAGFVASETETEIVPLDVSARKQTLAKPATKGRRVSDRSLMQDGLQACLTPQEFSDLISYLETLK